MMGWIRDSEGKGPPEGEPRGKKNPALVAMWLTIVLILVIGLTLLSGS